MAGISVKTKTVKIKSSLGINPSWDQNNKYQQILSSIENMKDGLFTLDRKWRFSYINKSAARIFGKNEKQILGQHYGKILPTHLLTDFLPKYHKALKTKKPQVFETYSQTLKRYFLVQAYPDYHGATVYFQDITFQKKIAEELAERERHRELLFGGVSHELKNLLTSTKAYLQILKRRLELIEDLESLEYVTKIDARLTSLSSMMVDFIDLIRIRSDRLNLHKQSVDVGELIIQTVQEIQSLTHSHKIIVAIKRIEKINLDRNRIKQVLTNLIDNAIKYSPKAKLVKIRASQNSKLITISVQDFGQGIGKKHLLKIFDPFYRGNWERQKKVEGLGLGLFICNEIIGAHGGKIIVKSQRNKGSTFKVLLPLNSN